MKVTLPVLFYNTETDDVSFKNLIATRYDDNTLNLVTDEIYPANNLASFILHPDENLQLVRISFSRVAIIMRELTAKSSAEALTLLCDYASPRPDQKKAASYLKTLNNNSLAILSLVS